eukprot:jgi/Chrzof1/1338/Cz10g03150.t1
MDAAAEHQASDEMYTVVVSSTAVCLTADEQQPDTLTGAHHTGHLLRSSQPHHPRKHSSSQWRSIQRKPAADEPPSHCMSDTHMQHAAAPSHSVDASTAADAAASSIQAGHKHLAQWSDSDDFDEVDGQIMGDPQATLTGIAQLALLPSGAISGHFVDQQSKLCLGITGRQLLAEHTCYRDVEWGLMELTIIHYGSNPHDQSRSSNEAAAALHEEGEATSADDEYPDQHNDDQFDANHGAGDIRRQGAGHATSQVVTWAQRTGGDLFKLEPADMDDDDTADAIGRECLGLTPDHAVVVNFQGSVLFSDASAEDKLRQFNPALSGKGTVVNTGSMMLTGLPMKFMHWADV